jgi:hypothetical protein
MRIIKEFKENFVMYLPLNAIFFEHNLKHVNGQRKSSDVFAIFFEQKLKHVNSIVLFFFLQIGKI